MPLVSGLGFYFGACWQHRLTVVRRCRDGVRLIRQPQQLWGNAVLTNNNGHVMYDWLIQMDCSKTATRCCDVSEDH